MISDDEIIAFTRESLGLSQAAAIELIPFEGRGSDRAYFRLKWGQDSVIAVRYEASRIENLYFADIASFLLDIDVPVPSILRHDPSRSVIVMQDLGDVDLWILKNEPWSVRKILYQKTLAIIHRFHTYPKQHFPSERVKLMDAFDPSMYRWERDYFRENFVKGVCGAAIEQPFHQDLETELAGLAERLSSLPRCLVHRDLQSQNVMIWREEPYLIDFQGMRFGATFYDLGSLLCDPYVNFAEEEREELLFFYYGLSENVLDWRRFQNAFWEAAAQRLMQALGAYGFLGRVRGLKRYLSYIPGAIRNLRNAAEKTPSLPKLLELVCQCEQVLKSLDVDPK